MIGRAYYASNEDVNPFGLSLWHITNTTSNNTFYITKIWVARSSFPAGSENVNTSIEVKKLTTASTGGTTVTLRPVCESYGTAGITPKTRMSGSINTDYVIFSEPWNTQFPYVWTANTQGGAIILPQNTDSIIHIGTSSGLPEDGRIATGFTIYVA